MAKKRNFYYVLVFTNNGPIFVTRVNWSKEEAEWNKLEKPLELDQSMAKDLSLGLLANLHIAYMVHSPIEITNQVYRYADGHFEWKFNDEEEIKGGK